MNSKVSKSLEVMHKSIPIVVTKLTDELFDRFTEDEKCEVLMDVSVKFTESITKIWFKEYYDD